jgi:hypothetical protein
MRTKLFLIILLVVLMVFSASPLLGGNDSRKGTAGAMELLIPVGARSSATSGALSASVSGTEAIFWNPAGLSRVEGVEAMFSNMSYIADININYFAIATKFGSNGALAVSLKTLNFGDIKVTTTDQPEGTGSMYSPSYITFGLTYSNKFTDRIFGGATIKYVTEKIVRSSATGIAADLGIQYFSSYGINLGISLKNLGPQMQFDGPDLEYFTALPGQDFGDRTRALRLPAAGFDLPSTMEIGIGYDYNINETNVISFGGSFQNCNFGSDEYRLGAEYCWDKTVFVRAGVMRTQQQSDNIYGPTFGFGVNLPLGGTTLVFDYSYRQTEYFDGNQWVGVKLLL